MFYGTNFGVGKFIYQSVIPVTLGDIVAGAVLDAFFIWLLYGKEIVKNDPDEASTTLPPWTQIDLGNKETSFEGTSKSWKALGGLTLAYEQAIGVIYGRQYPRNTGWWAEYLSQQTEY